MAEETEILSYFDIQIERFPDRSARWLFQDGENVRGLVELVAIELAERIDFGQMTRIDRSFVPDNLGEQESDMVFRVPFRSESGELIIYILIEHQSSVDLTMGFRMLFYMTQIWDSQRREWEAKGIPKGQWRFRPILPIVFYTGDRRWSAPLSLNAVMDIPDALARFVPAFDILFLSVKETDAAELTKTNHPLGWLLTVLRQENADTEVLSAALVEAISHLNALDDEHAPQRRRAFLYLLLLILHRRPAAEQTELRALVNQNIQRSSDREEVVPVSQSMAELLVEQGIEQGIEQGVERGRTEGRAEGRTQEKQANVLKILRLRFDAIPESITDEISLMRNPSRLDALLEQAVTAKSLNEIDFRNHDS